MSIPQAGGGRGPVHHRNMSEPTRAFMFPPPSPKSVRGEAGMQESPTEANRSFKRVDGIRMGDLYANLPSGSKVIACLLLSLTLIDVAYLLFCLDGRI